MVGELQGLFCIGAQDFHVPFLYRGRRLQVVLKRKRRRRKEDAQSRKARSEQPVLTKSEYILDGDKLDRLGGVAYR